MHAAQVAETLSELGWEHAVHVDVEAKLPVDVHLPGSKQAFGILVHGPGDFAQNMLQVGHRSWPDGLALTLRLNHPENWLCQTFSVEI